MKQYYVFEVEMDNRMKSFNLLPLTKEALFVEGKFFPSSNRLVLIHPHQKEVFDLIEKFDAEGKMEMSKLTGKAKVERLRTLVSVNYQLNTKDTTWFLNEYCINPEVALEIIESYKPKPIIHTAENMETVEEVRQNLIITE